ncbi:N-6 DNA methylase [uncultured Bosea sp.]|uniref:N-6 DNA methylase n=1 Tax=uncultured Bosea sp. TaxID=211457 RepID=UPI0025E9A244|nr:N-6 DNA methylase [uncultured Bosea sp.]
MAKISETETVIKKILPYLERRGYDVSGDITFEYPTASSARASLQFVDILVKHAGKIAFLIEAKRIAKTLSPKDREQAIEYGNSCKVPFVVVTNGAQFESYNSTSGKRIRWNGRLSDKIPGRSELSAALTALRKDSALHDVPLKGDSSLPFRPGLPLKQLNALFARCHNTIRKNEKNEDHAFSDFAKLLFLKLLEEKSDSEDTILPYSYRFHELAEKPEAEADQVQTAINAMLKAVKTSTPYGDVLTEKLHLTKAQTFRKLVIELSQVSFRDSRMDSKGAAFEYFVRATLKGKKLGQYFTPRPLVELMHAMIGREKIVNSLLLEGKFRVVDPACGTGGFLVYLMQTAIERTQDLARAGKISVSSKDSLISKIRTNVFFGGDAHEGVASSAKMNMIIAGDGHSNIQAGDSLAASSTLWSTTEPCIDLIITNPPFGTSESETLEADDLVQFPVGGARGQILFLQKMIQAVRAGGEICTVIDEGLLNTEQAAALRGYIMEHTIVRGIVRLPDVTFKPNKINVKSSLLHLEKRAAPVPDLDDDYPFLFIDAETLGYDGTGEPLRGVDFSKIVSAVESEYHGAARGVAGASGAGDKWRWFTRSSLAIAKDLTKRFDLKYWEPDITARLDAMTGAGATSIRDINLVKTRRGKSPPSSLYVDEDDGHAIVIKAGTNISRFGTIVREGDYIEKNLYDEMSAVYVQDGDILVSSTGDGTLGKCAVYRGVAPAIFDGHVALIRVNPLKVHPEYLCDYLRAGFGAQQIARLFTGSTGLIELPAEALDRVIVNLPKLSLQRKRSESLRAAEKTFTGKLEEARSGLASAQKSFAND